MEQRRIIKMFVHIFFFRNLPEKFHVHHFIYIILLVSQREIGRRRAENSNNLFTRLLLLLLLLIQLLWYQLLLLFFSSRFKPNLLANDSWATNQMQIERLMNWLMVLFDIAISWFLVRKFQLRKFQSESFPIPDRTVRCICWFIFMFSFWNYFLLLMQKWSKSWRKTWHFQCSTIALTINCIF